MKPLFNPEAFGKKVKSRLAQRGLSFRDAESEIGLDKSSICRVTHGKPPSVETYLRLMHWLDTTKLC